MNLLSYEINFIFLSEQGGDQLIRICQKIAVCSFLD